MTCLVEDSVAMTVDHEVLVSEHVQGDPAGVDTVQAILYGPATEQSIRKYTYILDSKSRLFQLNEGWNWQLGKNKKKPGK